MSFPERDASAGRPRPALNVTVRNLFIRNSRLIILFLLVIVFSSVTTTFWRPGNWNNVLNIVLQQAPFSILLAIVMTLAKILNGLDLSMGAGVALVSSVLGMVLNATYNPWLGIGAALALGALIGLCNGFLIAKVGVSPFIATYSMQWILRGLALVLLGGRQIFDLGPRFRPMFVSNRYTFFIITAAVAVVLSYVLNETSFGRKAYATGANIEAATISGIRTDRVQMVGWLLCGILVSLAAIMFTANLGCAEPVIGDSFPIDAVAASLIGGSTMEGGSGRISNAVIGAFILLTLINGMVQVGVPSVWQQFVIGAVIIVSVVLERGMEKISVETV